MGDNRYHELLGVDAAIEQPNYYELLRVATTEGSSEVIEKSYKEQMTKLQQNKSPKHKGFIEFLKDELRNAKLTLTNAQRRKEYDATLNSKHVEGFKQLVTPLLALGEVPFRVFETLVANGVSKHGLTDEAARALIQEMAKAANATVQTSEPVAVPPPPPPPLAAPPPPPPPPPGYEGGDDVGFVDALDDTGRASQQPPGNSYYGAGSSAPPAPAEPAGPRMSRFSGDRQTPAPPSADSDRTPSSSRIQRGRFYDNDEPRAGSDRMTPRPGSRSPSDSDWNRRDRERAGSDRAGSDRLPRSPSDSDWKRRSPDESGRRPASGNPDESGHRRASGNPDESGRRRAAASGGQDAPVPPWQQQPRGETPWFARDPSHQETPSARSGAGRTALSPEQAKIADEARKAYNGGIKLAKLAVAAHDALAAYFPRNADPIPRINGVSFEEAFRTENKMLKEALPQFKKVVEKLGSLQGAFAEDLRTRAENNMRAVELYMKEWKELKFKLEFQGASKAEMNRLWSDYSRARRIDALKQEIEKPGEYV